MDIKYEPGSKIENLANDGSFIGKLYTFARAKYRLKHDAAEDAVQEMFYRYLIQTERFDSQDNHEAILFGIFRNVCREYITGQVRERKKTGRITDRFEDGPKHSYSVLDGLMEFEDGREISGALDGLRPEAREMLMELAEKGRRALIEESGLNKNTLDSRIHVYRRELREALAGRGIFI